MANYKLCNSDKLDADIKSVADTIRAKSGTTAELEWPAGFKTAVEGISTGVRVQTNTGTLSLRSGSGSINCGFKPDFISLSTGGSYEGYLLAVGFGFTAHGKDKINAAAIMSGGQVIDIAGDRTSTGASFKAYEGSNSYSGSFSYVAVKYT